MGQLTVHDSALWRIIETDPRCSALCKRRAEEIIDAAKSVFIASQRLDNEWRLSETTPPKYLASFKLRKIQRIRGFAWRASNDDPGWHFVEFGAHAGGKTFVLRYRPLARGLDIVGASHG